MPKAYRRHDPLYRARMRAGWLRTELAHTEKQIVELEAASAPKVFARAGRPLPPSAQRDARQAIATDNRSGRFRMPALPGEASP